MDTHHVKICIVDDDKSVCNALKRLIKSAGFDAESYTSAQEFLRLRQSKRTDILVLDVRMPGMGGLDLQKRLKKSESKIPVIFITAHEDKSDRIMAMKSGAVAFFQKPVNDVDLLSAIESVLKKSF